MNTTSIGWTDYSANPLKYRRPDGTVVWACEKLSPGCANCYAASLTKRWHRGADFNAAEMAKLTPFMDEAELRSMLIHKPASGKRCFVGDMTDIFGEWVSDDLLDQLFAVFAWRPDVTWQVLTKRAARMCAYFNERRSPWYRRVEREYQDMRQCGLAEISRDDVIQRLQGNAYGSITCGGHDRRCLPNVWLGVSAEDQPRADERIPLLLQTPAAIRFVSFEPLIGPIVLKQLKPDGFWPPNAQQPDRAWLRHIDWPDDFEYWTTRLDWGIGGGESGGGARRCDVDWLRGIAAQFKAGRRPFFVKQGSGPRPGMPTGDHYLDSLKEFPAVTA